MIPKFVISFIYVLVLVRTEAQEVETNAIEKNVASGNKASILESELTKKNKNDQSTTEVVKIQLYYESLCPFCRSFGSTAFKDTVIDLGSYLDVHVYPFGNAWILKNGTIICQHGPTECYGNKLHACAIDFLNNITLAVLYNSCLMDSSQAEGGSDDAAADVCGKSMNIDSEAIKQCAKGSKGEELLKFYGNESRKVDYNGVPTILINGVAGSEDHFKQDVCKKFQNPPKQCNQEGVVSSMLNFLGL